jgi:poly-beta-1,6-N-acetyl-D-glucosamine synthase
MQWLFVILVLPYFFLLLKIYRSLLKIEPFTPGACPEIFVSIIVACRNEEKNLPQLLSDIAKQDYPSELSETIIVDDNSTDKTFDVAEKISGIINKIVLKNKGSGKKSSIRTGIEAARGALIITTDADCRMKENWISIIVSFFAFQNPGMIICPVRVLSQSGFFGNLEELEFFSLQGVTAGTAFSGNAVMCNGANLAFPKKTWLRHSGYLHDEIESGDDVFFLHSLKKENREKILWLESRNALVTTTASQSAVSFLGQRARWISKGKAYKDNYTILLAIVTFVTILLFALTLITGFIYPLFMPVYLTIFMIKSIPDFLILSTITARYGRKILMKWFLPAQIIYPFYVLLVVGYSVIHKKTWK